MLANIHHHSISFLDITNVCSISCTWTHLPRHRSITVDFLGSRNTFRFTMMDRWGTGRRRRLKTNCWKRYNNIRGSTANNGSIRQGYKLRIYCNSPLLILVMKGMININSGYHQCYLYNSCWCRMLGENLLICCLFFVINPVGD